ncbi:MAG TPA: protein phosphatase 2C domain-containing protein [Thermoanaerobaculia bacterium]|nr:protein phosphatase 2C domain-containing protein [Thermoanaerobaculia bacterium]
MSARPLAAAGSDPGRERQNNEDRVLCDPERGIYAVIDGVGGESGGEVAAQTALEILQARLSRRTTEAGRLIREAIALANKQIYDQAQANPALANMACVLTVAVVDGAQATVGHVGDSRLYLLRRGEIRKITRDHSPVGAREDAREISEEEAMSHPRRNEIFRDVGSAPHQPDEEGFIDITPVTFEPDSALLLCSDGLSDLVPSQTILSVVEANAGDPQSAVGELIAQANAAGGKDNVSVVLVEGERFADSVRRRQPEAASRPALRGAGHARSAGPGRFLRAFVGRAAFLFYGLILGAFAFAAFAAFGQTAWNPFAAFGGGSEDAGGSALLVGVGDGGTATIGEALGQARPGQTILVSPGEYREALQLRNGVKLVSVAPGAAVILPPPGSGVPAVTAQGVQGARIEGFRIAGDPQSVLQVGLRLADSRVEVEGVEITGAATAGIEVAGADLSTVRYSYVHDNPGGGVLVEGSAAPRLLHNLIFRNGRAPGAPPRPGVEVRGGARPALIDNRIEGNAGGGVALSEPGRADEVFAWNSFGLAGRAEAVRLPAPAPALAPPAAARQPGRSRR